MRPPLTTLATLVTFARAIPVVHQEPAPHSADGAQQGALLPPEGDTLAGDLERRGGSGGRSGGSSGRGGPNPGYAKPMDSPLFKKFAYMALLAARHEDAIKENLDEPPLLTNRKANFQYSRDFMYKQHGYWAKVIWHSLSKPGHKTIFDYDLPESGHGVKHLDKKFRPLAQRVPHGDASATFIGWPTALGGHMNLLIGLTPGQLANLNPFDHKKGATERTSALGAFGPRMNAWRALGSRMFMDYVAAMDDTVAHGSFEEVADPPAGDDALVHEAIEAMVFVNMLDLDHTDDYLLASLGGYEDPHVPTALGPGMELMRCEHGLHVETAPWPCPGSHYIYRAPRGEWPRPGKLNWGVVRHALSALERDEYQLAPYHRQRYVCWYQPWSLATMSLDRAYHVDVHVYKETKFAVSFPRIQDENGKWLGLNIDAMQDAWQRERTSDDRYYRMKGPKASNCASMTFKVLKAGMDGSENRVAFNRGWNWDKTFPQTDDAHKAAVALLKLSWMFADQYRINGEDNAQNAIKKFVDISGHPECAEVPAFRWGQLKVSSTPSRRYLGDNSAMPRR